MEVNQPTCWLSQILQSADPNVTTASRLSAMPDNNITIITTLAVTQCVEGVVYSPIENRTSCVDFILVRVNNFNHTSIQGNFAVAARLLMPVTRIVM